MQIFAQKDSKITEDARAWRDAGHSVYVYWISKGTFKVKNGPMPDIATTIEDIESAGWRLEQVTTSAQFATFDLVFRAVVAV